MKKVLLTLFIFISAIMVLSSCAELKLPEKPSEKPSTEEIPKGIEACKYKIIWSTNIIYTNSYDKAGVGDNEIITVHGFFEKGKNDWVWKGIDVELNEKYFGQIKIVQQITDEGYLVETYLVPPVGIIGDWRQMELRTLKHWEGDESKEFDFNADKTPWVLNAGYKSTSKISTNFQVDVLKDVKGFPGVQVGPITQVTRTGLHGVTVEEKDRFTIKVTSSGCSWWVKIGIEP